MELKPFVIEYRNNLGERLLEVHLRAPTDMHAAVAASSYETYAGGGAARWFECTVTEQGKEPRQWVIVRGNLPYDDRKAVEGMDEVRVDRIIR